MKHIKCMYKTYVKYKMYKNLYKTPAVFFLVLFLVWFQCWAHGVGWKMWNRL